MKRMILVVAVLTAFSALWNSCSRTEQAGTLRFGLEFTDDGALKSAGSDLYITAALVTITGENGEIVAEKELLPLYRFGEQYITESLTLPVGNYTLTEFMLTDDAGTILWATPVEGSPLAHLVRRPLPIPFVVGFEQTTDLHVQVVRVEGHSPSDFGYVRFPIDFVERFCLRVFYSYTLPWVYRDSVPGPDGLWMHIPKFTLSVYMNDRQVLNALLYAGVNDYEIPLGGDWYELVATDMDGREFYKEQFPLEELLMHSCTDNAPPLVIYHAADSGVIITPEGLYEPTIAQGVFGNLTVPVDDSIMTGQYDFAPVIYDVYFYPYALMDSAWAMNMGPTGCYFPEDMLLTPPVAIVRPNSGGYFQVPLESGKYLYLVKTDTGFYFDAWISSHLPGQVIVYPGEVTRIMIHVIESLM
ncbi:MAG TPA: hypothetical protein ENO20_13770 [Bacteroides sp.]|nr:hypothetical protein [Bacteroides sp.]